MTTELTSTSIPATACAWAQNGTGGREGRLMTGHGELRGIFSASPRQNLPGLARYRGRAGADAHRPRAAASGTSRFGQPRGRARGRFRAGERRTSPDLLLPAPSRPDSGSPREPQPWGRSVAPATHSPALAAPVPPASSGCRLTAG